MTSQYVAGIPARTYPGRRDFVTSLFRGASGAGGVILMLFLFILYIIVAGIGLTVGSWLKNQARPFG